MADPKSKATTILFGGKDNVHVTQRKIQPTRAKARLNAQHELNCTVALLVGNRGTVVFFGTLKIRSRALGKRGIRENGITNHKRLIRKSDNRAEAGGRTSGRAKTAMRATDTAAQCVKRH